MARFGGFPVEQLVGAAAGIFERAYQAGFDPPDAIVEGAAFAPLAPTGGSPFAPVQLSAPSWGGPLEVAANPFGSAQIQAGSPFGAPGAIVGGGSPFGPPVGPTGDPFGRALAPVPTSPLPQPGQNGPTQPGQGGNWGGPTTAEDNKALTGQQVNAYIARARPGSPLAGMGDFILQEANARNISVPQLLGIMMLESELGTTGGLNQYYNYGGLTGTNWGGQTGNTTGFARPFATFATKEDGLRALMDNLASDLYRGKSLQQQIGLWYLGDANAGLGSQDEKGNATLQQYLNTIGAVYQALGVPLNPGAAPTPTGGPGGGDASDLVGRGRQILGNPYQLGGRRAAGGKVGPGIGIDCSEFTAYLYEGRGVNLTWNAQAQYNQTGRVQRDQWQPGDLVFFQGTYDTGRGEVVTHVGMFAGYDAQGNPMMLHAGTNGVEYANLNSDYWSSHFYGVGRVNG